MEWPTSPLGFLARFKHIPEHQEHLLRDSQVLFDLPDSSSFYRDMAVSFFPGPIEQWESRQRLVNLFAVFLRLDGRTFSAMLHVLDCACESPDEYGSCGVNSLAAMVVYLDHRGGEIELSDREFVKLLERYAQIEVLKNNAEYLLRFLDRRSG